MPSAEADSVCSTSDLPALPCRAFTCRHFVAEIGFVPPSVRGIEFRNSLLRPGLSYVCRPSGLEHASFIFPYIVPLTISYYLYNLLLILWEQC